ICKPLGMTSSGFLDRNGNNQGTVIGYRFHNETFTRTPVFVPNSGTYAGGIYSTATDLAAFISLQFRNDAGSKEILSKDARLMMHAFNIGWKPAYPLVLHEGSMLGFRSVLVVSPEHKVGWVILTNTTDFDFSRINSMLGQLLLPIYEKKSVTDLNRYTGNYKLEGGYSELDIYLKDGQLYSTYMNESLSTPVLIPSGNNRFRSEDKNGYSVGYEFLFDDKSEKTILNLGQLMWVKTNKHTP
ncbi:serine hydrolase, partial [Bacteroides sp. OttesenSCG-928-D19]|nr:serine hydrolase [Bacteroides sp. OttesenSCG-928-D19]